MKMPLIAAVAVAALSALPAEAQRAPCGTPMQVLPRLQEAYGPAPLWSGDSVRGHHTQVWANPETGEWAVVVARPAAICVMDAGGSFQLPLEGEPT